MPWQKQGFICTAVFQERQMMQWRHCLRMNCCIIRMSAAAIMESIMREIAESKDAADRNNRREILSITEVAHN